MLHTYRVYVYVWMLHLVVFEHFQVLVYLLYTTNLADFPWEQGKQKFCGKLAKNGCENFALSVLHASKYGQYSVYATEAVFFVFITRGRILRRNWDKSLKSFPSCYSQSPLRTNFFPPPPPPEQTSSLRTLKSMPRNLNEIVRSWIRLPVRQPVYERQYNPT
jgi:hypothetical protein